MASKAPMIGRREELQGRANAPEATDRTGTPEASVGGDEAGVEATEGECEHVWGIDGQHSNEYCKKCFVSRESAKGTDQEYERWEKEHAPAAYWERRSRRLEKEAADARGVLLAQAGTIYEKESLPRLAETVTELCRAAERHAAERSGALQFLYGTTGGRIVSSGDLTTMQIAEFQARGKFYIEPGGGLGWAVVPWNLTTDKDRARELAYFRGQPSGKMHELASAAVAFAEENGRLDSAVFVSVNGVDATYGDMREFLGNRQATEVSPAVKKALSTYQNGRELVEENERLRADLKRTLADHETACEKMRSAMAALMVRLAEAISLPPDDNLRDSYPLLVGGVICRFIAAAFAYAKKRWGEEGEATNAQ